MYWLTKLARHKVIASILIAMVLGFAFGTLALAVDPAPADDPFGTEPFNEGVGGVLGNQDLRTTIGKIVNVALSLLGVIAVVIILVGGFKWMTAGGNDEKVTEARKLIFAGIIGLAIILSAWAISLFVLKSLSTATGSGKVPEFE